MRDHADALRAAVRAAAIDPPAGLRWFERPTPALPAALRRVLTRAQLLANLETRLAETLYENFYCRGSASPLRPAVRARRDGAFVGALSRANAGRGCREHGWRIIARGGATVVVRKGGLSFEAPARIVGPRDLLVVPNELRWVSPGFYVALGDSAPGDDDPVVRIYWNLSAAGAPAFVRRATRLLNARAVPFRLKVANTPAAFVRCDAGVLYLRRSDASRAWPLIASIRRAVRRDLFPATPAFTKELAAGVAAAEEPEGGASFGMDRCGIVARALVEAASKGRQSIDARLGSIELAFAGRGLDLSHPFLEPGSADRYAELGSS